MAAEDKKKEEVKEATPTEPKGEDTPPKASKKKWDDNQYKKHLSGAASEDSALYDKGVEDLMSKNPDFDFEGAEEYPEDMIAQLEEYLAQNASDEHFNTAYQRMADDGYEDFDAGEEEEIVDPPAPDGEDWESMALAAGWMPPGDNNIDDVEVDTSSEDKNALAKLIGQLKF